MYERFTERAREVVNVATQEAASLGCRYVGTEHLLTGLLADEASLAWKVLDHLNISEALVQPRVKQLSAGVEREENDPTPTLTEGSKKALELSLRQALNLGHNYIGTEHILLGLVSKSNNAVDILRDLGVNAPTVRDEVVRMLSGPEAPILTKDTPDSPKYEPPSIEQYVKKQPVAHDIDLIATAVTLGRQFPEVQSDKIASAAIVLYG